jgi:hypothetical protein
VWPSWQHSSSGANSSTWVRSLIVASLAPILNSHFKSTPFKGLRRPPQRNHVGIDAVEKESINNLLLNSWWWSATHP